MHWIVGALGVLLLGGILVDAFETIVLPRRIGRAYRITRAFYRATWPSWRFAANRMTDRRREAMLSWYGPGSLLLLLSLWAVGIVLSFSLLHWAAGSGIRMDHGTTTFLDDVYFSSSALFTLMMSDESPFTQSARWLALLEAGIGFGLLGGVIGYLPVIYQAFSRREVTINLLDARAGTPPTASALLTRLGGDASHQQLTESLREWERWASEVLESHLSYPVLAYFRSQHSNESWLAALTAILDATAIAMSGVTGRCLQQARLTFAMARHAVVDLAQVFNVTEPTVMARAMTDEEFATLAAQMNTVGIDLRAGAARTEFERWHQLYEPYVTALGRYLLLDLPPILRRTRRPDNWESAPWKSGNTPANRHDLDDHFA